MTNIAKAGCKILFYAVIFNSPFASHSYVDLERFLLYYYFRVWVAVCIRSVTAVRFNYL